MNDLTIINKKAKAHGMRVELFDGLDGTKFVARCLYNERGCRIGRVAASFTTLEEANSFFDNMGSN